MTHKTAKLHLSEKIKRCLILTLYVGYKYITRDIINLHYTIRRFNKKIFINLQVQLFV